MAYSRALFIRFGGMGDILLATPSVRALRENNPGIEIDFIVGKGMAEALAGNSDVDHVISFDKNGGEARAIPFARFLFKLARRRYDIVLNFHPSVKSFLMSLATMSRKHVVFKKTLKNSSVTGKQVHAIDDFTKELASIGIPSVSNRELRFDFTESDDSVVYRLLADRGWTPEHKLVIINPAATRPINRWDSARFGATAKHFASLEKTTVVVTGAPRTFKTFTDGLDEVGLAETIAAEHPSIINLAGKISVKQFGALIARSNAFLTCDTGPMHIAAALRANLVVLSGAADPNRTGPITPESTVLFSSGLDCAPCRAKTCARGDKKCMTDITVDQVILAIGDNLTGCRKGIVISVPSN